MSNPYLEEIHANLPRLLALFDNDQTSLSYGMGDRYHWAWGLIDFGNGTFQGAAHGLARLWSAGLWPYPTSRSLFLERINAMIEAASKLIRRDGSLEEAFPHEGSYCVTALVALISFAPWTCLAKKSLSTSLSTGKPVSGQCLLSRQSRRNTRFDLESFSNCCGCIGSLAQAWRYSGRI